MMELLSGPQEIQGLLHQIHAGDDAAWEELLRLVHDRLEKLIRVMFRGFPSLRGFIEWEDVLQNVLVRLLRALRQIEPASMQEFFALAGAHVRRELLNQACKRKKVSARQAGLSANSERTFFDAPLAEESAAELDQWSRFHQEVEKLPAREREVLSLIFYHGWTQRQIAKLLCITVRTVRRYRRTAMRKIQKALEHSTRLERDRPKP